MWENIWTNTLGGVATTAVVSGVVYFVRFLRRCRRYVAQMDGNVAGLRRDLRRSQRKARQRFEDLEDRVDAHDERFDEHHERIAQHHERIARCEQFTFKEDNHGQDTQTAGG